MDTQVVGADGASNASRSTIDRPYGDDSCDFCAAETEGDETVTALGTFCSSKCADDAAAAEPRVGVSAAVSTIVGGANAPTPSPFDFCRDCKRTESETTLVPVPYDYLGRKYCADRDSCSAAEAARFRRIFHDDPRILRAGEAGTVAGRAFVRGAAV